MSFRATAAAFRAAALAFEAAADAFEVAAATEAETAAEAPVEGILGKILAAFPDGADRVRMADVRAHLATVDPVKWAQHRGEEQGTYEARVGKQLAAELDEALDGTGAELTARQVRMPDGKRPSGYYRAHVEAAVAATRR